MISWDKMRYFYYVADECSMTKAAARLNISQTSISKHIKDLEAYYDHELFLRKNDGLELTQAGKDLFDLVKTIYEKATEANKRFCHKEEEIEGDLKIVTTPGIASSWIMDHIGSFLSEHPKLNIFLIGTLRTEDFPYKGPMIKISSGEEDSVIREYITTFTMNLYAS